MMHRERYENFEKLKILKIRSYTDEAKKWGNYRALGLVTVFPAVVCFWWFVFLIRDLLKLFIGIPISIVVSTFMILEFMTVNTGKNGAELVNDIVKTFNFDLIEWL